MGYVDNVDNVDNVEDKIDIPSSRPTLGGWCEMAGQVRLWLLDGAQRRPEGRAAFRGPARSHRRT